MPGWQSSLHRAAVGGSHEAPDDILAISWADLTAQGIQLRGPGADELLARVSADAGVPIPDAAQRAAEDRAAVLSKNAAEFFGIQVAAAS